MKTRIVRRIALLPLAAFLLAPTCESALETTPDDAGAASFYREAMPKLWGRRPRGTVESRVLGDLENAMRALPGAPDARLSLVNEMLYDEAYVRHWTGVVRDLLQVQWAGVRVMSEECFGPPTLGGPPSAALAAWVRLRTSSANEPEPSTRFTGWNMTDLIRSSLVLGDLSPVFTAYLTVVGAMSTHDDSESRRRAVSEAVQRTYAGRDMSCLGCHRTEMSTSGAASWDRHWPLPINVEPLVYGRADSRDWGTDALAVHTANAFRLDARRPLPPGSTNLSTPWNISGACVSRRNYTQTDRFAHTSSTTTATLAEEESTRMRSTTAEGDMVLLPTGAATGKWYALGVRAADGRPMRAFVNVATAASVSSDFAVTWEYSAADNGWTAFANVQDGTNGFRNTGWREVTFGDPAGAWKSRALVTGGPEAYWIRARATAGSVTASPKASTAEVWTVQRAEFLGFRVPTSDREGMFAGMSQQRGSVSGVADIFRIGVQAVKRDPSHWEFPDPGVASTVFWEGGTQNVRPILAKCGGCHSADDAVGRGFTTLSYGPTNGLDGAAARADVIKARVMSTASPMPPPGSGVVFTNEERQAIAAWVDGGWPENPQSLPGGTPLSVTSRQAALALMTASTAVDGIWHAVLGHRLTIINGFPRNEAQQQALGLLTKYVFVPRWDPRSVIREALLSPYFNRPAPRHATIAANYPLPMIFNPWAAQPPSDTSINPTNDPEFFGNGQGDVAHRHSPVTILSMASAALGWNAPAHRTSTSSSWPSAALSSALGQRMSDVETGMDQIDTAALLTWEGNVADRPGNSPIDWFDTVNQCFGSGVTSNGTCARNGTGTLTVRDLVLTVKDWLIQQPWIEPPWTPCAVPGRNDGTSTGGGGSGAACGPFPSDEELALRALFGVATLDAPFTSIPAAERIVKIRKLGRSLLKSGQFLISHLPPRSEAVPALKMRACLPGQACSFEQVCNQWRTRLATRGWQVACSPDSLTVPRYTGTGRVGAERASSNASPTDQWVSGLARRAGVPTRRAAEFVNHMETRRRAPARELEEARRAVADRPDPPLRTIDPADPPPEYTEVMDATDAAPVVADAEAPAIEEGWQEAPLPDLGPEDERGPVQPVEDDEDGTDGAPTTGCQAVDGTGLLGLACALAGLSRRRRARQATRGSAIQDTTTATRRATS